ncbi:MAG: U32 family peptidase [Fibrobacterales bacterium]
MSSHLLIPVGNREMCLAAIHNGATEVYFGVPGFNARGRTIDFDLNDMKELIDLCHLYGVEANLAFNVVVFEDEIRELTEFISAMIQLSPDAFIVQDIGLIKLIKAIAPEMNIHVSTQMTVTNALAIDALDDLSVKRVTLSREMTLDEIEDVSKKTNVELEVFVHGALCVAYSGQCLTSEVFGGRSANRGQCAQTCRLDFELIVDGETRDLDGKKYLLSPQDLCGVAEIPQLQEMGITALKIEGRLKSPAYVASTTSNYRAVMDNNLVPEQAKHEMELLFSRGFYSGWLHGVNHQELVNGFISSHQGSFVGEVIRIIGKRVEVSCRLPLKAGDGISFLDFEQGDRYGARIYGVEQGSDSKVQLSFNNEFEPTAIAKGWKVYQNDAPDLEKELQKTFTQTEQLKTFSLDLSLTVKKQSGIAVAVSSSDGYALSFTSSVVPELAKSRSITETFLEEESSKLGKSCYRVGSFSANIDGALYISQKQMRGLRKEIVEKLDEVRVLRTPLAIEENITALPLLCTQQKPEAITLSVLIRDPEQIAYLEGLPIDIVYLDFDYGRRYEDAMSMVRSFGFKVGIATLRVIKPFDTKYLDIISGLKPDVVLARNLAALHYFKNYSFPVVTDYSFNICNSLSAEWFVDQGVERFTPGHDLNMEQLTQMMTYTLGEKVELILHHYMPTFYMEHCPYAAFMSKGTDVKTCGKPCRKHKASLKDHKGVVHPVKPDYACRNTMYHGVPQSSGRLIDRFKEMGVSSFRIEALYETKEELRNKVNAYNEALTGALAPSEVVSRIDVLEKYGVSEGQLMSTAVFENRKKER